MTRLGCSYKGLGRSTTGDRAIPEIGLQPMKKSMGTIPKAIAYEKISMENLNIHL
jgi:hypothetical protein